MQKNNCMQENKKSTSAAYSDITSILNQIEWTVIPFRIQYVEYLHTFPHVCMLYLYSKVHCITCSTVQAKQLAVCNKI